MQKHLIQTRQHHLPRLLDTVNLGRLIGVVVIASMILTEAHTFFRWVYPVIAEQSANKWFFGGEVMFKGGGIITVEWWIKSFCDELYLCLILFIASKMSYHYGNMRVFLILAICSLYQCVDTFLLLYNWKQGDIKYILLLVTSVSSITVLIIPVTGKLRRI